MTFEDGQPTVTEARCWGPRLSTQMVPFTLPRQVNMGLRPQLLLSVLTRMHGKRSIHANRKRKSTLTSTDVSINGSALNKQERQPHAR